MSVTCFVGYNYCSILLSMHHEFLLKMFTVNMFRLNIDTILTYINSTFASEFDTNLLRGVVNGLAIEFNELYDSF